MVVSRFDWNVRFGLESVHFDLEMVYVVRQNAIKQNINRIVLRQYRRRFDWAFNFSPILFGALSESVVLKMHSLFRLRFPASVSFRSCFAWRQGTSFITHSVECLSGPSSSFETSGLIMNCSFWIQNNLTSLETVSSVNFGMCMAVCLRNIFHFGNSSRKWLVAPRYDNFSILRFLGVTGGNFETPSLLTHFFIQWKDNWWIL